MSFFYNFQVFHASNFVALTNRKNMKLNHLNLAVTDVHLAVAFLEKYFGLINQGADDKMGFLTDDNGAVISLMKTANPTYPGNFHIGFIQESEEKVNEINARLKNDGYEVPPPKRAHGWTFYFKAPGGYTIEVLC
jgi:catechol 2,3-dioxygenase-like lactoylglutathione lyase family enzyme